MRLGTCIALIALQAVGLLATVSSVGKPRRPLTGGTAAAIVAISSAVIVGVLYLYASAS